MITITQTPLKRRTPDRPVKWFASTTIDGVGYSAESRKSAPHELARQLVAASISDQPVQTIADGMIRMTWPSLHRMALFTIGESSSTSVRVIRHREWPAA